MTSAGWRSSNDLAVTSSVYKQRRDLGEQLFPLVPSLLWASGHRKQGRTPWGWFGVGRVDIPCLPNYTRQVVDERLVSVRFDESPVQ